MTPCSPAMHQLPGISPRALVEPYLMHVSHQPLRPPAQQILLKLNSGGDEQDNRKRRQAHNSKSKLNPFR